MVINKTQLKEVKIPIKIIKDKKTKKRKIVFSANFPKFVLFLAIITSLIIGQSYLFSAYEAHVINITAKICRHSETRTMGFWKNHEEYYERCLETFLGELTIVSQEHVDAIFDEADADNMSDMLRGQLLAMKFNVCNFGIGGYTVENEGITINEIINWADDLLTPPFLGTQEERNEMEEVKNILDYLNNLHQLRYCSDNGGPYFVIDVPEPLESVILGATINNYCGDGILYAGEECDDGNNEDGDGCDSTCMKEIIPPVEEFLVKEPPVAICGNDILEEQEECDDGNNEDGDGCSAICIIELPPEPICGDGIINNEEECDGEEGILDHYICTDQCLLEYISYCGDQIIDDGEECDDGLEGSETCSAECTIIELEPEPICGDNTLDDDEECDDGNIEDGDGCSATCTIEEPIIEE